MIKTLAKVAVIIAALVLAYIYKGVIAGIVIGFTGALGYFTYTGSTILWKKKK